MHDLALAVVRFYADGFRNMRLGRVLWTIVLVKLIVFFGVIKPFFMPDYLESRFHEDTAAKAAYVLDRLTEPVPPFPTAAGRPRDQIRCGDEEMALTPESRRADGVIPPFHQPR